MKVPSFDPRTNESRRWMNKLRCKLVKFTSSDRVCIGEVVGWQWDDKVAIRVDKINPCFSGFIGGYIVFRKPEELEIVEREEIS